MDDYIYSSKLNLPQEQINSSTTLDELDKLEKLERLENDEYNIVPTPGITNPDILSKQPLFMKTVPEKTHDQLVEDIYKNQHKKVNIISIKNFATNIANSLLDILNDILSFNIGHDDFIDIFTKDDRLIAIGILMIIISIFFILFRDNE